MARSLRNFLGGAGLALFFLELVIRQFWTHARLWEPGYVKTAAPHSTTVWRIEGNGVSHHLDRGVRAGFLEGAPKILVLGDSFTEALDVNDDEVFSYIAQQRLNDSGNGNDVGGTPRFGVVNAGVLGRSVADYIGFQGRHEGLYHPVWTVLTMHDDDLAEDSVRAGQTNLQRDADGTLAVHFDEARSVGALRDRLWNAPSIAARFSFYRLHRFAEAAAREPPLFRAASAEDPHPEPWGGATDPLVRRACHFAYPTVDPRTFPVEEELDLLAKSYSGRFTVLLLPYVGFIEGREPVICQTEIRTRVFAHCKKMHYSCVEPADEFLRLAREGKSPVGFPNTRFNFGHMNRDGHLAVGTALASHLKTLHALF